MCVDTYKNVRFMKVVEKLSLILFNKKFEEMYLEDTEKIREFFASTGGNEKDPKKSIDYKSLVELWKNYKD